MSHRNRQLSRVLRILLWLQQSKSGLTIKELKAKLESHGYTDSLRTIYRDLEGIEASGIPLVEESFDEDQKSKRWKLLNVCKLV